MTEGAGPILMNIPLFIEFLVWRHECDGGNGILEKHHIIILRSVEIVAQLRVLTIFQLAVVMRHRWLSANSGNLAEWDFGAADMAATVDLLYNGFGKVIERPERYLEDDFMIDEMWAPITKKVPPFRDFLTHMYEEHTSNPVGKYAEEDKTLPYDVMRAAVFYPTRRDIVQSTDLSLQLGVRIATTMRAEFVNPKKNTARYLSAIGGKSSLAEISEEQRVAGFGVDASNSVSESVHAASTDMLVVFGTIRTQYCAAIGQTRSNNDFGRAHKNLVQGQKKTSTKTKIVSTGANTVGAFHKLSPNAQKSLIRFSKEHAKAQKQRVDGYLREQFQTRMEKAMVGRRRNLTEAMETYIDALFCLMLYYSLRRWRSGSQARREYAALTCEGRRS